MVGNVPSKPVTVGELKRLIKSFPDDAIIITPGYDEIFDIVKRCDMIKLPSKHAKHFGTNDAMMLS